MRACALTLDLDGPSEYARIHDVDPAPTDPLVMYGAPLQRFMRLCQDVGITPTLFAVGRDVDSGALDILRLCQASGAELAAHSYAHDYAMTERDVPFVFEDVARVASTFERAFGAAPKGFRAPGYLTSRTLFDALSAAGFAYDSSILPSPSYVAVKAAVLATYKLLGKRSASRVRGLRASLSRTAPHRRDSLVELPISVVTPAKLPLTATALMLAPAPLRTALLAAAPDIVIINAHAMDFVDATADKLAPALTSRQPELRLSIDERLNRMRDSLIELLRRRAPMTCAEIAARF